MIILGIDPGYAIVGTGVVEYAACRFRVLEAAAVTTPAGEAFPARLARLHAGVTDIINRHHPTAMAIEKLYFNTNTTTAIDVAQARGVLVLAAKQCGVPVFEYTPLQVKQAVVGYGRAEKQQVQEMVRLLLRLEARPKPDDVADALAIAICHAHTAGGGC
ncbi:MAG: crossover junction endodeoxyribonuclease RuvC [Oscillospiraceae bacterium]|jgi:crossover junction endodeoxyribonuclease RuvC|nr:crossover junction endodeoxyribonuclease RuvC [Oscillospiraceae bacterium]